MSAYNFYGFAKLERIIYIGCIKKAKVKMSVKIATSFNTTLIGNEVSIHNRIRHYV